MFFLILLTFGLTTWLGIYLLTRNFRSQRLQAASLGLLVLALGLALELLYQQAPDSPLFSLWHYTYFYLLPFPWVSTLVYLPPDKPLSAPGLFPLRHYRLLMVLATLIFTLGNGLLYWDFSWLPRLWALPLLGAAWLMLGGLTAVIDAHETEEPLNFGGL